MLGFTTTGFNDLTGSFKNTVKFLLVHLLALHCIEIFNFLQVYSSMFNLRFF